MPNLNGSIGVSILFFSHDVLGILIEAGNQDSSDSIALFAGTRCWVRLKDLELVSVCV